MSIEPTNGRPAFRDLEHGDLYWLHVTGLLDGAAVMLGRWDARTDRLLLVDDACGDADYDPATGWLRGKWRVHAWSRIQRPGCVASSQP